MGSLFSCLNLKSEGMEKMFQKILIANRGEIAIRIIRACRELNIASVAIYSEADRNSLHVKYADEAICVGPAHSNRSYLDIPNILSAAVISGADAIHPGYGYLSERADFAEICESHGLTFIGPTADQIEKMGNKSLAKKTMAAAGLPVIPGSDGPVTSVDELVMIADEIGYPVIIKASAGGGGKGMRLVHNHAQLVQAFQLAQAEAEASFGNADVYLEKFIENPRHIEVQILADNYGNVVHLGERECSLQRRHQKILEESPSPIVDEKLRKKMGAMAVKGAKHVDYRNAGTIEFLVDEESNFYFMEMNTRIQVEHPVTEAVYGIDLIKEQIRLAAGDELGYEQKDIIAYGHAIECRINAEDPENGFLPSPGMITKFHAPGGLGVRWDSFVYSGQEITPFYDSMFGKLICWGIDRNEAIERSIGALEELEIEGIKTNKEFHLWILQHDEFRRGNYSTNFIEREIAKQKIVKK